MRSKRILILAIFITLIITSCRSENVGNVIYPVELTESEEELLDLIASNSDIGIYNIELEETFNSFSIWIETYKRGNLVSNSGGMKSELINMSQNLVIMIKDVADGEWEFALKDDSSLMRSTMTVDEEYKTLNTISSAKSILDEKIEIVMNKDIVLYTYIFDDGNGLSVFNSQYYIEHPEALNEYDFSYIIKCKFSDEKIIE